MAVPQASKAVSIWSTATYRVRRARFRSRVVRAPVVAMRHRGLGETDAFVASYPRSGSTWTLFLLSDAIAGRPGGFGATDQVIPYVGQQRNAPQVLSTGGRLVRTHEVVDAKPGRVIYLMRDPRSVVVSEHRWQVMMGTFDASLEAFVEDFVAGRSNPWGSWGSHVRFWLDRERRGAGTLLTVCYERLRQDPATELRRILTFLGEHVDPCAVERAVGDNSLARMREKELAAPTRLLKRKRRADLAFVGAGDADDWRPRLAERDARRITDEFADELSLAGYSDA